MLMCRLLILLLVMLPSLAAAKWYETETEMMGTRISVELWSEDTLLAEAVIEDVLASMQAVNLSMNPWDDNSELSAVNQGAAQAPIVVSDDLYRVVERALYYSRLSQGAFDISFASVGQYYDYREARAPTAQQLEAARPAIDYHLILLDPQSRSIAFASAGVQLDLGGIAKGFAVDQAIEIMRLAGIQAGYVSAGGDARILGKHGDRPRVVGIRHPRRNGEFAVMIPLEDTAISTSGDYERFFMQGDIRVHHILDPGTGHSAGEVQSSSVLAASAIDSDALSTATFVLGVERGLELINSLPGIEAIMIDALGKLHYSQGLLREVKP
jgi:thiamine biosynthesis lipoprotein